MEFGLTEMPCPSRVRKNPYYEDIVKYGYSIVEHYSPEDVAEMIKGRKSSTTLIEHDEDELAAFEEYYASQKQLTLEEV
ncbi:MAG: hypothetical protein LBE35_03310 [Clostridiales bacterium]|jgi:hypothetical protein|nr:hypothetical protein [Clostridiales bacterium]